MAASDNIYTLPNLREKLKDAIKSDNKGGPPGKFSARKSQLLSKRYISESKKRGKNPFIHSKKRSRSQKSLSKWSKEKWRTSSKKSKRYLPDKVWNKLSAKDKKQTNAAKARDSRRGRQYSRNPLKVRTLIAEMQ